MKMTEQLQEIEDLIIQRGDRDLVADLRNKLAALREQVEAYQENKDRQDQTLQEQAKAIELYMEEIAALKRENAKRKDLGWKDLVREGEEYQAMLRKRQLDTF